MTARVVNPVHETFFTGDTVKACYDWIVDFAGGVAGVTVTGPNTYKVGDFNLYIFEDTEAT